MKQIFFKNFLFAFYEICMKTWKLIPIQLPAVYCYIDTFSNYTIFNFIRGTICLPMLIIQFP